jgi:Na+-translocating ferredoxin:NAD+ oxidoreductase subunit B
VYMSVPFVFGIYEFQLNRLDKELADLVEEYAPTFMGTLGKYAPAMARVVPVNATIQGKHEVHRYEDIRQMIEKSKAFQLTECICRKERAIQGHPCNHSTEVCMGLSAHEGAFDRYAQGKLISKEEALQVIAKSEEEGLVHTTFNVQKGHIYVCNCCPCCCGILLGVKRFNLPYLMASSNFVAFIDENECSACGVCAQERCPMEAISEHQSTYRVQPERCIGCGVCTTTCPNGAISLIRKPDELQDQPPANLMDWYMKRADSRGVKISV